MKYSFLSLLGAVLLAICAACDDTTTIGSVIESESVAVVVDSDFTVQGHTLANSVVQSRTISQLLGVLDAPGYGSIRSDFVAQFMPSLRLDADSITATDVDSLKLFIQMDRTAFVGDSLVPMGMEVYQLKKDLPYPIYSDFDPEGYYEAKPLAKAMYVASTIGEPDSVKKLNTLYVQMSLPVSLGRYLLESYKTNPAAFADPETFARDVFKGLYVRTSYGAGRISDFTLTSMRMYYHRNVWNADSARYDYTNYYGDYFAVTPEVVVNNNIHYAMAPQLKSMIEAGDQIVVAPAGTEVEMTFPAEDLMASYNRYSANLRVVNTLSLSIPADSISNEYKIGPPPYLLMVLKKDKEKFFANNSLTDNVTSFYATYNATTGTYDFNNLRGYMMHLIGLDNITADDYTFILTPVQVNTESTAGSYYYGSSTVDSSIVPYVSKPAMTRLRFKDAKIKLTYSAATEKDL